MDLKRSYFAIPNPFEFLERWLHPFIHSQIIQLRNRPCTLEWTSRAEQQLNKLPGPLQVEMQLYFSCVVKKRVLFNESQIEPASPANEKFLVEFRTVMSESCNPEEFAENYPVKKALDSEHASKMAPSLLRLDYRNNEWSGSFVI